MHTGAKIALAQVQYMEYTKAKKTIFQIIKTIHKKRGGYWGGYWSKINSKKRNHELQVSQKKFKRNHKRVDQGGGWRFNGV